MFNSISSFICASCGKGWAILTTEITEDMACPTCGSLNARLPGEIQLPESVLREVITSIARYNKHRRERDGMSKKMGL